MRRLIRAIHAPVFAVTGNSALLLTSFIVSISAAHSLDVAPLAAFFVCWTLESFWIGAIRQVLTPALLLTADMPRLGSLCIAVMLAGLPVGAAVFIIAIVGEVGLTASVSLAVLTIAMACYETSRSAIARSTSMRTLAISDIALLGTTALGTFALLTWAHLPALEGASTAMAGASLALTVVLSTKRTKHAGTETVRSWVAKSRGLLAVGIQEWLIFAIVGMTAVAIMGWLGGAPVLSGVRLGETLSAPVGLASSVIPLIGAMSLRSHGTELRWPRGLSAITGLVAAAAAVWFVLVLFAPEGWIAIVVGPHVTDARLAYCGLFIGGLASIFVSGQTLLMKKTGHLSQLSRIRWMQLILSLPLLAAGAVTQSIFWTGMASSATQVLVAILLLVAVIKTRGARKTTEQRTS